MTIRRAIGTILSCTLMLAMIGAGIGYGIGVLAPGYYRTVFFRSGREPGFQPVSVGVGLGLTQGTTGGVIVGLAVVALLCWRETRIQPQSNSPRLPAGQPAPSRSVEQWLLLVTGSILALAFCAGAGFLVGAIVGEGGSYHRRYLEERDLLAPALTVDPAFARVEIFERSNGGVFLVGEVPSAADLERLRGVVVRAIGERGRKRRCRLLRLGVRAEPVASADGPRDTLLACFPSQARVSPLLSVLFSLAVARNGGGNGRWCGRLARVSRPPSDVVRPESWRSYERPAVLLLACR